MPSTTLDRIDIAGGSIHEIASDVLCLQTFIVNVIFVGKPHAKTGEWVLIDTGIGASMNHILEVAEKRFGKDSSPKAIVLTHGHFDHVGTVVELANHWDVPVYAHDLEMPYLTGQKNYPPPDPSVGGGLMAAISPIYPRHSINLGNRVRFLPTDGSIPPMEGWKWIHTPGHTQGHISLFRESDGILIVGDAFTTVKQESAMAVLTQRKEIHGPPAYFTTDWETARNSVIKLKNLNPSVVITGHGLPLHGEELKQELENLVRHFDEIAVPDQGKYVDKE